MSQKNKTAFISYAREDYEHAITIFNELKKNGIHCWIDKECLRPGELWKHAVTKAIKESSWFIAVLSNNSVAKRGYVQKELKLALEILDEIPENKIYLIPVRLDDCEPSSDRIYEYNWIDLFPSFDHGLDKIIKELPD